jgi:amidase/aspartyl-tRNA(Asn)/glutamyl-tRNA(Gln) amidotransferase subunit A
MARSVADAAAMLHVLSGRDSRDWYQNPLTFPSASPVGSRNFSGLRVGVWGTPPRGAVAPDVRAAFEAALAKLSNAGAALHPITLPDEDLFELFTALWYPGAASRLAALPPENLHLVEAGLREVAEAGARYSGIDLIAAAGRRAQFGAAFEQLFAAHGVIVSPAVALTAIEAGKEVPDGSGMTRWTEWAGFSYPINLSQSPASVVPCGFGADGMPVGLQIIGRRGDDSGVLAVARAYEQLAAA